QPYVLASFPVPLCSSASCSGSWASFLTPELSSRMALTAPPKRITSAVRYSHSSKMITAPSDPYVAAYESKKVRYTRNAWETAIHSTTPMTAPGEIHYHLNGW